MKQVAVFKIPSEQKQANDFLAKNPPENVAVLNEMVVINYDDGTYPDSYKAEELRALMISNEKGAMTTDISIGVGLLDLKDVEKDIKDAQEKLEAIQSTVIPKGKSKKDEYILTKDRENKIKAHEDMVKRLEERKRSIEQSIAGLRKTVSNFQFKNQVLAEALAKLKV